MGRGVNNPPVGELGGGGDENVPQQLRWLHSSEYTESQQIVHFKSADCMGCALYLNKAVQKREKNIHWRGIDSGTANLLGLGLPRVRKETPVTRWDLAWGSTHS